jgi:glycosyltransferase involved in cell wall biosynthesis
MIRILHIVKYYDPSNGGMESVVKNIVRGVISVSSDIYFTVYSNNQWRSFVRSELAYERELIIKERTLFHILSQPISFFFPSLKALLVSNDVIHHHYPYPTMEFALLRNKALIREKKFIVTWHANIENSRWGWLGIFYTPFVKKLLGYADHIIVTSPQLLESSLILKEFRSKVSVLPIGFSINSSTSLVKVFPENRPFTLLFVGKLRKYKGLNYLLHAITSLDVKLIVIGNGEEYSRLVKLSLKLGLDKRVFFLSEVSDVELVEIYMTSDLFVLPSINEAEAFGVVQLEAMVHGLPVINTKLNSGVPFVSLHNYSGFTVVPKSSSDIRDAIVKIISSKKLYEEFSRNSITRSHFFSVENMVNGYLKMYL